MLIGIPCLRENDRYNAYKDAVIKAATASVGDTPHDLFITMPIDFKKGMRLRALVEAMNKLVDYFLAGPWELFWVVELDIQVPIDAFSKLVSLNADVVQGWYSYHHDCNLPIVAYLDENGKMFHLPRNKVQGQVLSGMVFAGMGCALIKRRVFQNGLRFRYDPHTGHDILFALDVQKEGFVLKVHGDVYCGHLPEWPLERDFSTLDVGCGDVPRGDVNCDLNVGHTLEGGDQSKKGVFISAKEIPNFVRCNGQALPFCDGAFEKVLSYDVIEHVEDPSEVLLELIRVAKSEVEVRCPSPCSVFARMPFHRHILDPEWFEEILSKLDVDFNVQISDARGKSHENVVTFKKRSK